jgi:hypothetical protein
MSLALSLARYIFRTIHMFSFSLLLGNMFYDHFFIRRFPSEYETYIIVNLLFIVLLIVAGLVNFYLLTSTNKYVKNFHYEVWRILIIVKLILSLFLTQITDKIFTLILKGERSHRISDLSISFKAYLTLTLTLLSVFLRYYRESFLVFDKKNYPADQYYLN